MSATFELTPDGKRCVYKITHKCKSSVLFVGAVVESLALSQVKSAWADEFAYLVAEFENRIRGFRPGAALL